MTTRTLRLKDDQLDTLLMVTRYCELHHPTQELRTEIRLIADEIYRQLATTDMFPQELSSDQAIAPHTE